MRRARLFGRILCATALLSVAPAFATVISTYSDLASWSAASTGVQTINFEGIAPFHGQVSVGPVETLAGVTFDGMQGSNPYGMYVIDTSGQSYWNFGTNGALELPGTNLTPTPSFHIVLPAAVTSFSFNLMSASPNGVSFSVTAGGSTFTVPTFSTPAPGFFGATFDAPVSTIDVTPLGVIPSNYTDPFLDNFGFGAAAASQSGSDEDAPEAGTLMMIGSGLVGLTTITRRRRAKH